MLDPNIDARYYVRQQHEQAHLQHRLVSDRQALRDKLAFWRAVAFVLAFLVLALGYGYIMHWAGVW
jgi:anti-sigma-K factor RskA